MVLNCVKVLHHHHFFMFSFQGTWLSFASKWPHVKIIFRNSENATFFLNQYFFSPLYGIFRRFVCIDSQFGHLSYSMWLMLHVTFFIGSWSIKLWNLKDLKRPHHRNNTKLNLGWGERFNSLSCVCQSQNRVKCLHLQ